MTPSHKVLDPNISLRFTQLRKIANLTQKQLGELLGFSSNHIWKFENGGTPIPMYVINLLAENIRLFGITVTKEWVLSGHGEEPFRDPDFDTKIKTHASRIAHDPLTHFFTHALSLTRIYDEKLILFVGGIDFEPHISAGTYIIAPKIETHQFNPDWAGFYLFEANDGVIPVKLTQTQSNVFNVSSLHVVDKKRLYLSNQTLCSVYPAIGTLSRYQVALSDAKDISTIIQKQSDSYVSIHSDLPLENEEA